jgi:hypothetical protein
MIIYCRVHLLSFQDGLDIPCARLDDPDTVTLPDNAYSLAVNIFSIQRYRSPWVAAANVLRTLTPGGMFVWVVPSVQVRLFSHSIWTFSFIKHDLFRSHEQICALLFFDLFLFWFGLLWLIKMNICIICLSNSFERLFQNHVGENDLWRVTVEGAHSILESVGFCVVRVIPASNIAVSTAHLMGYVLEDFSQEVIFISTTTLLLTIYNTNFSSFLSSFLAYFAGAVIVGPTGTSLGDCDCNKASEGKLQELLSGIRGRAC